MLLQPKRQPSPYKGKVRAKTHWPTKGQIKAEIDFVEAVKPLMYNSERIDFACQAADQLKEAADLPIGYVYELAEKSRDWDFSEPVVDENGEVIREPFGTWDNFYKAKIEPIAGPYAEFLKTFTKVSGGEITEAEGQEEIKSRIGSHGGDRKSEEYKNQACDASLKHGTKDYFLARLERDHPDILSDYELGHYKSVRAAAIAAGIIKVQSPYEMIGKQLAKLNRLELMDLHARITAILQEQ